MDGISQIEAAKIIRDLLRIAKAAKPGQLYDEDPGVLVARAALEELETAASPARPPNLTSRAPALDVTRLAPSRPVEMSSIGVSFVLEIPWPLVDALHDAQADFARLDAAETVQFALRDWLTGHGYLTAESETH
jgi:hypothetical protein